MKARTGLAIVIGLALSPSILAAGWARVGTCEEIEIWEETEPYREVECTHFWQVNENSAFYLCEGLSTSKTCEPS